MTNTADRIRLHSSNAWAMLSNRQGRRSNVLRRYAFDAARQVTPAVVASSGDFEFLVPTSDKSLGRATFSDGHYELDVMANALRLLTRHLGRDPLAGKVFVDVGANIGTSSIPALLRFGASAVVAIEPSPTNYNLLRCNAILNGVEHRMTCVNAAVSVMEGTVALELSESNSGDHRVRSYAATPRGDFGEEGRRTISVEARQLDRILHDSAVSVSDVGLLWADTQGHEGQVLQSASSLLSARVPALVEYWPYGLRRSDGLALFNEAVRRHFSRFIDVRTGEVLLADQIDGFEQRYQAHSYTDLALVP